MSEQENGMMQEILTKLTRIETMLGSMNPRLEDHEARIRELEGKSGKRWDSISLAIITAILAGIVGIAIGKLF